MNKFNIGELVKSDYTGKWGIIKDLKPRRSVHECISVKGHEYYLEMIDGTKERLFDYEIIRSDILSNKTRH